MSDDFTAPSDPERDPYGRSEPRDEWGQSPPVGIPPQPSPWGEPPPTPGWENAYPQPPGGAGPHDPQPPPTHGSPVPHQPMAQQPWPQAYGGYQYPKSSQAVTSLVLSILGLVCCGPVAVIGALIGRSEVQSIDRGEIDPSNRGTAQAGYIVGLIGCAIWFALIAFYVLAIAVSVAAGQ